MLYKSTGQGDNLDVTVQEAVAVLTLRARHGPMHVEPRRRPCVDSDHPLCYGTWLLSSFDA